MPEIPHAYVSHRTPGRLRIKVPVMKGYEGYFSSLREKLSALPDIARVETNALTGSALIIHSSGIEEIVEHARQCEVFHLKNPTDRPATLSYRVVEHFRGFDKEVKRFTGGEIDIPSIAFVSLLGVGAYQIGRGNFMAIPWYAAFWYALNIFLKTKPEGADTGE